MPSSFSTSLRFELQFTGENVNLWGDKLNAAIVRADSAIAGWLTKALTADYVLTTANGAADEARTAMLKFTGTGAFAVTVPAVSKRYDVWNACTGDLTLTNGSASVLVRAGEVVSVVTDGGSNFRRVQPTDLGAARLTNLGAPTANQDAATKKYVDDTAFAMAGGSLPGQGGNANKVLTTNGTTPDWSNTLTLDSIALNTVTLAGNASGSLRLNAAAGVYRFTRFQTNGLSRWDVGVGVGAESGVDAGSDFFINAYSDAGGYLSTPLAIQRSTGTATFNGNVVVASGKSLSFLSGGSLAAVASAAGVQAGSSSTTAVTPSALAGSSAFQTLPDTATIVWNAAAGYNARVTLTASGHTLDMPSNLYDGLCLSLEIIQDATGSRTVNWHVGWDFGAAGLPILQTTGGKADRVFGQYNGRTGKIDASFRKGA